MRKWKSLSRRGLSLLMTLVLCAGLLQLPAFAAGDCPCGQPDCDCVEEDCGCPVDCTCDACLPEGAAQPDVQEKVVQEASRGAAAAQEQAPVQNDLDSSDEQIDENDGIDLQAGGPVTVETAEALAAAVRESASILLGSDMKLEEVITIPEGAEVTLDLNGHTITVAQTNGKSLYAIDNYGIMTITDDSETRDGKIIARGVTNKGTMYMKGGTIESCDSNGGGAAVWNEGNFEMTGGKLAFTGEKSGNSAGAPFSNANINAIASITGGELVSPYTCMFVNAGNVTVKNISVENFTSYWMAFKAMSGAELTLNRVTVNSKDGGCIENAGGIVDLTECTFIQGPATVVPGEGHTSSAVAVSNGGTVNVHSGSYTSAGYGVYVFNSGGTINIEGSDTVIKGENAAVMADTSANGQPANVYIKEATVEGAFRVNPNADVPAKISIESGTIKTDSDISTYIAPTAVKGEDNTVRPRTEEDADAVAKIGSDVYASFQTAIDEAKDGETVTLVADSVEWPMSEKNAVIEKKITINLSGKLLNITGVGTYGIVVQNNGELTIENGSVNANDVTSAAAPVIEVTTGSSLTLDAVGFETKGAALFPRGDAAKVSVVNNSKISAPESYAVATNASGSENYNVIIELKDSTFIGNSPVLINVPGRLVVDHCQVTGDMHGIIVRGGTAEIKNSEVTQNYPGNSDNAQAMAGYFEKQDWGSGNMVNLAAITIGNKGGTAYQYPSNVIISNTEVNVAGNNEALFPCVYVWANEDSDKGVTLDMNGVTFTGTHNPQVEYGNNKSNITENKSAAKVDGKAYPTLEEAVEAAKPGDTVTLLKDVTVADTVTISGKSDITLDGNGKTITSTSAGHGLQVYCSDRVTLKNVNVTGAGKSGLIVNASSVTVEGALNLEGNGGDGFWKTLLNVCYGSNISSKHPTSLTFAEGASLHGIESVYSDASDVARAKNAGSTITVSSIPGLVEIKGIEAVPVCWTTQAAAEANPAVVAKVGEGTYFGTLQAAIDAAENGDTVTLLKDTEVATWNQIWNLDGVTIDGGDHTLKVEEIESNGNGDYLTYGAKNLTVKNLIVDQSSMTSGKGGFSIGNGSKLENVTIKGGTYGALTGSDVTITGCTFENVTHAIYTNDEGTGEGLTVDGCIFTGGRAIILRNNEKFTNNTVGGHDGTMVTVNSADAVVTGNTFTGPGVIELYKDAEIEKNQILCKVEKGDGLESADLSRNYWGGGAPADLPEGVTASTHYTVEVMTDSLTVETAVSVQVGNTVELHADVQPVNSTVTWTSGNEAVATVDTNGVVTAVAVGTAAITAQVGELNATCTVTVTEVPVTTYTVTFNYQGSTSTGIYPAGTPAAGITIPTVPSYTSGNYRYTFSRWNPAVAAVTEDAVYTAVYTSTYIGTTTGGSTSRPSGSTSRPSGGSGGGGRPGSDSVRPGTTIGDTDVPLAETPFRFVDVPEGSYCYDAVYWAVDQKITNGVTETTFVPGGPCTRAQIVTFLWRAAGSPAAEGENPFTDVDAGAYYYNAVLWAVANGITGGATATTFNPNAPCTRGQAVTFLYRAAGSPEVGGTTSFTDLAEGAYYTNAVLWAVEKGVTGGTTAATFAPNATCTRGQIVTFLHRDRA